MMCVGLEAQRVIGVALKAHLVGAVPELQGRRIRTSIRGVGIMAMAALCLASPIARRTHERFTDECRFAEPAVFVKGAPREVRQRPVTIPAFNNFSLPQTVP